MKSTLTPHPKFKGRSSNPSPFKDRDNSKFMYIWPSSIPESWDRIFNQKHITKIRVSKGDRNTIGFLQETQKYIEKIRKPINLEDLKTTPSSYRSIERIIHPRQPDSNSISPKASKNNINNAWLKRLKKYTDPLIQSKNLKALYKANNQSPILNSYLYDLNETPQYSKDHVALKKEKKILPKLYEHNN